MRGRFLLGGTLGVLSQLSAVGLLLSSAWLISRAAEQPPVLYLMAAIVGVRFFGIARAALRYAERLVTHDAVLRRLAVERVRLFEALWRSAPRGLPRQRRGDLLRRVVADVEALSDRIVRVRQPFFETLVAGAVTVGVVAWLDLRIGLGLAAAVVACLTLAPALTDRLGHRRDAEVAPVHGRLAAETAEAVALADEAVVYGNTHGPAERIGRLASRLAAAERSAAWRAGLGSSLVALIVGATVCVSAVLGVQAVVAGTLAPVMLAVVVLAPLALWEGLDAVPTIVQHRRRTDAAMERIAAVHALRPSVVAPLAPVSLGSSTELVVRNLAVGWTSEPVARDLSFVLPAGSTLALTGPSGSGKSTVAATLARLIDLVDGTVEIGGVDTRLVDPSEVRRVIGLVDQEAFTFDTTVHQNLLIGDPAASDAEVASALRSAGLADFVARLPQGWDTEVGAGGSKLSGGERQRLAVARALVAGRRILVLDEPTEFLDRETAERLLDDLLALTPRVSLIVITHADWVAQRMEAVVELGGSRALSSHASTPSPDES